MDTLTNHYPKGMQHMAAQHMAALKELEQQMEREAKEKFDALEAETKAKAQKVMDGVRAKYLGDTVGPSPTPSSKPRQSNGTKARKASGNGRRRSNAPRGQRKQQMLELVKAQPGISTSEIAEKLGTDATGLYRYRGQLVEEGAIRMDGKQIFPVDAQSVPTEQPNVPATV